MQRPDKPQNRFLPKEKEGAIRPDSVHSYALGSLVLAVHPESGSSIRGLADLAHSDVKKVALTATIW